MQLIEIYHYQIVCQTSTIKGNLENQKSIIYLSASFYSTSDLKTAIKAEGISSWPRSKLDFCLNNTGPETSIPTPDWNNTACNATIADEKLTILSGGNIDIDITCNA